MDRLEAKEMSRTIILATVVYNTLLKEQRLLAERIAALRDSLVSFFQRLIDVIEPSQEAYDMIVEINSTLPDNAKVPQDIIDDLKVR